MTTMRAEELAPGRDGWAGDHRMIYLRSGGAQGHVMDLTEVGGRMFTPHCLIRHIGRRSGRVRITPLIYGVVAGEVVIVASNGGAAQHPSWYGNLRHQSTVDFQVATQAFRGKWREPEGAERQLVWDAMVELFPPYLAYQAATDRRIPIVMLSAVATRDVFAENDMNHPGGAMNVAVDRVRCQGHTLCAMVAPELFVLDDVDGHASASTPAVSVDEIELAREAARSCPERAIILGTDERGAGYDH